MWVHSCLAAFHCIFLFQRDHDAAQTSALLASSRGSDRETIRRGGEVGEAVSEADRVDAALDQDNMDDFVVDDEEEEEEEENDS
jgi:hypothetical protein